MKTLIAAALLFASLTASAATGLQTIYVGNFGQSGDADRLRMLLTDDLRTAGFVVVDEPTQADASISGALSVQVVQAHTEAYVTAAVRDKEGKEIWKGNYGSSFHAGNDAVKWRASDLTKALKKLRAQ